MSRRTVHQLRVVAILLLVFAVGYLIAESSDVFTVLSGYAGR
jgi:hypothetical protein